MRKTKSILYHGLVILCMLLATAWFSLPVTGTILVAMALLHFRYREQSAAHWRKIKSDFPMARSLSTGLGLLVVGLSIGFTIYRFGVELIRVPSASMETSIHSGKFILVNKLKPGPRQYASIPDKYFRMAGIGQLKRGDIVLFNFPEGDTILENRPRESYYYLKRHFNEFDRLRKIRRWGRLIPLQVEDRPRYVKRLAGLPGDTFEIKNGEDYVNGKELIDSPTLIKQYRWTLSKEAFEKATPELHIRNQFTSQSHIEVEMAVGDYLKLPPGIKEHLQPAILEKNIPDRHIFPFETSRGWNSHHLGPIVIPSAGDTISLTLENLPLYQRAIRVYENNTVEVKNREIVINGKATHRYCFKMNYYWVLGDNRPHSFDSRYWGFLPENHIIGSIPDLLVNKQ